MEGTDGSQVGGPGQQGCSKKGWNWKMGIRCNSNREQLGRDSFSAGDGTVRLDDLTCLTVLGPQELILE